MKKILITTESMPRHVLGGPGKFAPTFYEGIQSLDDNYEFNGLFGGVFYESNKPVAYANINDIKKYETPSLIRQVLRRSYVASSMLRNAKKIITKSAEAAFAEKTNNIKFDIIHAHDYSSFRNFKNSKSRLILTNHFKGSQYRESLQYKPGFQTKAWKDYFESIELNAISGAEVITFPSRSALKLLLEDYPKFHSLIEEKSRVIYTGIEDKFRGNIKANRCNHEFINIGNHIPDKGIDDALLAFKIIAEKVPDATFKNYGAFGSETDNLIEIAKKLGLERKVSFHGLATSEEILKTLSSSFALIHTPKKVVFDLVLLEAMSASIPIVTSKAEGNLEALGGDYPIRYDEGSIDGFHILDDSKTLDELTEATRMRYRMLFSKEKMIENYIKLYDEIS